MLSLPSHFGNLPFKTWYTVNSQIPDLFTDFLLYPEKLTGMKTDFLWRFLYIRNFDFFFPF